MPKVVQIRPPAGARYQFGASLAASGDALLVGNPWEAAIDVEDGAVPLPAVFHYQRREGEWTLTQTLEAGGSIAAEGFGRSLSLGASFAVASAPGNESGDEPTVDFEPGRKGAPFVLRDRLDTPDRLDATDEAFDRFGEAVAADEHLVFVGAPLSGDPGGPQGVVHLFERRTGSTQPVTTLRGNRSAESFGASIALSGDLLAIGAPGTRGAVYVYARGALDHWRPIHVVNGSAEGEGFGAQVAIDGRRLVVGAPLVGRVDLFELRDDTFIPIASIPGDPGPILAISLSGDRLAIGYPMFSAPGGPMQTGRVALVRLGPAGSPSLDDWLVVPECQDYARLGSSVALGPDYVATGAPGMDVGDDSFVAVRDW